MEEEKSMIIMPAMDIRSAKSMFDGFQNIKTDLLTEQDKSIIAGKTFVNKSGWRKIKTMFGFDEEILNSQRFLDEDGTIRWVYRVRVKHAKTGIFADAEASCDTKEDYAFKSKQHKILKPENMIMAMAQTRAFNRAISDLVGGGEAEIQEDAEEEKPQPGSFGQEVKVPNKCSGCDKAISDAEKNYSIKAFNKTLCRACQEIVKNNPK